MSVARVRCVFDEVSHRCGVSFQNNPEFSATNLTNSIIREASPSKYLPKSPSHVFEKEI